MKNVLKLALMLLLAPLAMAQTTGAPLNLALPNVHSPNWNIPLNNNFTTINSSYALTALKNNPVFTGIVTFPITGSTQCLHVNTSGVVSGTGSDCGAGGGAVSSVSNSNGTLTVSPNTGAVVVSLALNHANTWTATQTLSALTLSAITGSTQCLQVNTSGVVSGTGSACGSGGGGTVTGSGTANSITKWMGTSVVGNSAATDDGTTFTYNGSGTVRSFTLPEGTPATPGLGLEIINSNATAHTMDLSSNGGAFSPICTAFNGECGPQIPVEKFGAVGYPTFSAAVSGTDSTTAIQNCLNSITFGQCLLQAAYYRVTSALTINTSYIGINGTQPGGTILVAVTTPAPSVIVSTSATADIIDVAGTDASHRVLYNKFTNFALERSTAPTSATVTGLSLNFAAGTIVDHVQSLDSARNFYFHSAPSFGIGHISHFWSNWGLNGVTEGSGVQLSGLYLDSADGNAQNSLILDNGAATSGLASSVTTHGMDIIGTAINDVDMYLFGTGQVSIGININYTGSGATGSAADIHCLGCTNDAFFVSGIKINSTSAIDAQNALMSINIVGGYDVSLANSGPSIEIDNSTGVVVSNHQILSSGTVGILANTSGSLVIANNQFLNNPGGGISFTTGFNSVISGNKMNNITASGTGIALTGTSTNNAITGNSVIGFPTGISLDSTSTSNTGLDTNAVVATTPFSIAGGFAPTGNITRFLTVTGCTITGTQCVVTSPVASVTLAGIPAWGSSLEFIGNYNNVGTADSINMQINGDTGANYLWTQIFGLGATIAGAASGAASSLTIAATPGDATSAAFAGSFHLILPNYAGTTFNKTVIGNSTRMDSSSGNAAVIQNDDGHWLNTAAITSVKVFSGTGENFKAGSTFSIIAKP